VVDQELRGGSGDPGVTDIAMDQDDSLTVAATLKRPGYARQVRMAISVSKHWLANPDSELSKRSEQRAFTNGIR
jgi:hypothetical protein